MHIEEVRQKADAMGFKGRARNVSKATLIRSIQRNEGEQACFLTDKRLSCREACDWGVDCRKLVAAWRR